MPGFLGGEVILDIEALDLAGEPTGEISGIKAGDVGNAGAALSLLLVPLFGTTEKPLNLPLTIGEVYALLTALIWLLFYLF